jgi:predicted Zn-dependent peptidase
MSIESYQFESGLTVYVDEVPTANSAGIDFVVNSGGLDESDNEAGLSHLIEHVVHEGTELFDNAQARKDYEADSMYGSIANTSDMRTLYSARGVEVAPMIKGVGSMIFSPRLQDTDIDHEVEIVKREALMSAEDTSRKTSLAMMQAMFESPYSRPVIGFTDALDFTPQQVREFHRRMYIPANMAVIGIGKICLPQVVEALQKDYPFLDNPIQLNSTVVQRPSPRAREAKEFWLPYADYGINTVVTKRVVLSTETVQKITEEHDYSYVMASQLIGREVFRVLREEKKLSYDGSFSYHPGQHKKCWVLQGGVTVGKDIAERALEEMGGAVKNAAVCDSIEIERTIKGNLRGVHVNSDSLGWRLDNMTTSFVYQEDFPTEIQELFSFYERIRVPQVRSALEDLIHQFTESDQFVFYTGAEPPHENCTEMSADFTSLK